MAHVLWAILHVEYNGDGFLANRVHLGEPSYKVRSRSCQKFKILKCLILKKRRPVSDAECPQESNGAIFSVCGLEPPKNHV